MLGSLPFETCAQNSSSSGSGLHPPAEAEGTRIAWVNRTSGGRAPVAVTPVSRCDLGSQLGHLSVSPWPCVPGLGCKGLYRNKISMA